jgi:hypothetical protein
MQMVKTPKKRGAAPGATTALDLAPEKPKERGAKVAEMAFQLYEERGRLPGYQLEDWLEAERRVSDDRIPDEGIADGQALHERESHDQSPQEKSAAAGLGSPRVNTPGAKSPWTVGME